MLDFVLNYYKDKQKKLIEIFSLHIADQILKKQDGRHVWCYFCTWICDFDFFVKVDLPPYYVLKYRKNK